MGTEYKVTNMSRIISQEQIALSEQRCTVIKSRSLICSKELFRYKWRQAEQLAHSPVHYQKLSYAHTDD